jgi:hypothetical protein
MVADPDPRHLAGALEQITETRSSPATETKQSWPSPLEADQ